MKQIIFILCIAVLGITQVFSQKRPHDAYYAEEQTYFINLLSSPYGLIMTNNYASAIYLLNNGKLNTLITAPGCGRFIKLTPDKQNVLFKLISEDGKQTPSVLNLSNGNITPLCKPQQLCSQPVSSKNGMLGYSTPDAFYLQSNNETKTTVLTSYSNYLALSGDGNFLITNDNNDQLFLTDLKTSKSQQITDNAKGYVYPSFSPEDIFLVFSSLSGDLYIQKFLDKTSKLIGHGGNIQWVSKNEFVYTTYDDNGTSAIKYGRINSEFNIIQCKLNLPTGAMFATVSEKILYFTIQGTRNIYSTALNKVIKNISRYDLIYSKEQPLDITFNNIQNTSKSIVKVPGTVPYVNQVYDTPSWHEGWGSCAPTTSAMAFAYYNRLPPWPVMVDHGQSWDPHINNYGSYVADRYRFNEIYYQETADAYGTAAYGGYGYLWTGTYSPNSRMKTYIENHYMTSNQLWTTSCTYANSITEIDAGFVHPICNYLTTSGHLILTTGYLSTQHTLIFNDPYGNKNNPGYPNYTGYDSYYDWPGYSNGYQNLDASGTHGGVAWTVKARTTEPIYNDTIIDNVDYNHGFYMNNSLNGSIQRYYKDYNVGYNGHTWWTGSMATSPDICYVSWGPNLPQAGKYKVEVFIPSNGASAVGARYHIYSENGDSVVVVNQSLFSNEWVELGIFTFHAGQGNYVYLGDSTGIDGEMVAFDAMRWTFYPEAVANFTSTNHQICTGDIISFNNNSVHSSSYNWIIPGSDLNSSTLTNPIATYNSPGTYDVTLIAHGVNGNDTIFMPDYVVVNTRPDAQFTSPTTTIQLPSAFALFTNNSQNASNYYWNFGDGGTSTDQNPYHIYTATGNYTVFLIASNGLCPNDTLTINNYITVLNASGINTTTNSNIHLTQHENALTIHAENKLYENILVQITDELGRICWSQNIGKIAETKTISIPDLPGINIITLLSGKEIIYKFKWVTKN